VEGCYEHGNEPLGCIKYWESSFHIHKLYFIDVQGQTFCRFLHTSLPAARLLLGTLLQAFLAATLSTANIGSYVFWWLEPVLLEVGCNSLEQIVVSKD
jgi:hypothetical protein